MKPPMMFQTVASSENRAARPEFKARGRLRRNSRTVSLNTPGDALWPPMKRQV